MTLSVVIGSVDVSALVLIGTEGSDVGLISITTAADGSLATTAIKIEDPTGSVSLTQWAKVVIEESDCAQPRLFTGYLTNVVNTRGPYSTGAGRTWTADIIDLNGLLHLSPIHDSSAKRPVETGNARVAWLLASTALSGIVFDNGLVGSNTNLFDEADYTGRFADEVLPDVCVSSITETGRIFFVYWDPSAAQPSLFIDLPAVATNNSTLSISNVAADVNSTTVFAPFADAGLNGAGDQIYCGVFFKYKTGEIYRHNDVTHAAFFSANGFHRVANFETTRVGSSATAVRHADGYLAAHSGQLNTVSAIVKVKSTQVTLITAGMRLAAKFTHFPAFATSTYTRVSRMTVVWTRATNKYYELHLELSTNGLSNGGGTGSGSTGGFPHPPPGTAVHFYSGELSFQSDGYGTAHVTGTGAVVPNTTNSSSNTVAPTFQAGVVYNYSFTIAMTGGDNPPAFGLALDTGAGVGDGIIYSGGSGSGTQTFTGTFTPTVTHSDAYAYFQTGALGHPVGGRTTLCSWIIDPVGWDDGTTVVPPGSGQEEPWTVVTMSTVGGVSTGTTVWPYAPGSLKVKIDGLLISPASYVETNPATGAFALTWEKDADETVTVTYQGL